MARLRPADRRAAFRRHVRQAAADDPGDARVGSSGRPLARRRGHVPCAVPWGGRQNGIQERTATGAGTTA